MKKIGLITFAALVVLCSFRSGLNAPKHGAVTTLNVPIALAKTMPADTPGELPRSYRQRKFMNDIPGIAENPFSIAGNIVKFNAADKSYGLSTSRAMIKDGKLPVTSIVADGALYSGLVTEKTSFNGSYLISGLKVKPGEVMELTIEDGALSAVPDTLIDIAAIKAAASSLSADELKNLYYVKSATVISLQYRVLALSKFDPAKNAFYATWEGKTYSATGKIMTGKLVSVFLIPLDKLLAPR